MLAKISTEFEAILSEFVMMPIILVETAAEFALMLAMLVDRAAEIALVLP